METKNFESLQKQLDGILELVSSYPDETLNRKPDPEAWSVLQVMQHLTLSEKGSMRYVQKKTSSGLAGIPKAGLRTKWSLFLLWAYLYLPFKVKAPAIVNTPNFPLHATLDEVKNEWLQTRSELKTTLASLPAAASKLEAYRHPYAGRLTIDGMLRFFRWHAERHTRQIKRTLQAVTKS